MKSKTVKYFDWDDIQIEICKRMGIDKKYFRDYHEVIGGKYKDLWHEWMNYFDSEFNNGSIKSCTMGERIDCKKDWVKEDGKEWLYPFIDAVYEIWDEYNIENVKYSW